MWDLFIYIAIAIVIVIFVYQMKRQTKVRNSEEWVGVIEDKEAKIDKFRETRSQYILHVTRETGEKIICSVDKAAYNSFNVGDRVQKRKGQYNPVRIA